MSSFAALQWPSQNLPICTEKGADMPASVNPSSHAPSLMTAWKEEDGDQSRVCCKQSSTWGRLDKMSRGRQCFLMIAVVILPIMAALSLAIIHLGQAVHNTQSVDEAYKVMSCYNQASDMSDAMLRQGIDSLGAPHYQGNTSLQLGETFYNIANEEVPNYLSCIESSGERCYSVFCKTVENVPEECGHQALRDRQLLNDNSSVLLWSATLSKLTSMAFVWHNDIPHSLSPFVLKFVVQLASLAQVKIFISDQITSLHLNESYFCEDVKRFDQCPVYIISGSLAAVETSQRYSDNEIKNLYDVNEAMEHIELYYIQYNEIFSENTTKTHDARTKIGLEHLMNGTSILQWNAVQSLLNTLQARKGVYTLELYVYASTLSIILTLCVGVSIWYLHRLRRMLNRTAEFAKSIQQRSHSIAQEKQRSESVLHEMLPPSTARQLLGGMEVAPEFFSQVTIHFSNVVGFDELSKGISPHEVVDVLNGLYRYAMVFDRLFL